MRLETERLVLRDLEPADAEALFAFESLPEAARALVGYGFDELRLHRVWADCDPANTRSWRLLERLGMRREAHHVESTWLKGGWVDSYEYAVLDRDWAPL